MFLNGNFVVNDFDFPYRLKSSKSCKNWFEIKIKITYLKMIWNQNHNSKSWFQIVISSRLISNRTQHWFQLLQPFLSLVSRKLDVHVQQKLARMHLPYILRQFCLTVRHTRDLCKTPEGSNWFLGWGSNLQAATYPGVVKPGVGRADQQKYW